MNIREAGITLDTPITWKNMRDKMDYISSISCAKFALFCAKQVQHLITLKEAHDTINIIKLYLDSVVTEEECTSVFNIFCAAIPNGCIFTNAAAAAAHTIQAIMAYSPNGALYISEYAIHAIRLSGGNVELYKQEQVSYLKQLIIDELPEELKDNWLLVASI